VAKCTVQKLALLLDLSSESDDSDYEFDYLAIEDGCLLSSSTRLHGATTRRQPSSYSPPWEPQILLSCNFLQSHFLPKFCV
jgi:hypothetical protein